MSKNKGPKLFFFFLLLFVLGPSFVLASVRIPEINYPSLPFPGVEPPQSFIEKITKGEIPEEMAFSLYVKYFYHLILTISGLVAFGIIFYGGFRYLISVREPAKMLAARETISGGIYGLLLLLSSYLILVTINPQLTIFRLPALEKIVLPKRETPPFPEKKPFVYLQVPTGKIIEDIIKDQGSFAQAKTTAAETKEAVEKLNELAIKLKRETDKCICGTSKCGPPRDGCRGIDCLKAECNKTEIARSREKLENTIKEIGMEAPQIKPGYTPPSGDCSPQNLSKYWTPEALGKYWYPKIVLDASCICDEESSGYPKAEGPEGKPTLYYGLFQISWEDHKDKDWMKKMGVTKPEQLFDPEKNIKAAIEVFKDRQGHWTPWPKSYKDCEMPPEGRRE